MMKNKIDTTKWENFVIENLFDIKRPSSRSQSDYEEGEIPFIASGNYNNGVLKYLMPKDNELLDKGNCITVSPVDGSSFYQKEDFLGRGGAGSSIILLYNDHLNEKNGIFIATIIRKICSKYGYSDMGSKESIRKEIIKIPVDDENNPDWSYMEQYMKNLEEKVRKSLKGLNSYSNEISKVNINKWKKYKIGKLFDATNTGNVLSRDVIDGSGNIPYVTASGVNNGVVAHIDASKYQIIKGNCILVGGKTFTLTYQSNDFVSNDSHNFEMHLKNNIIGVYEYLFVISVLRKTFSDKYYWGDAVTKGKLLEEEISLPSTLENEPDWNYMKNYMMNSIKNLKNKINYLNAI